MKLKKILCLALCAGMLLTLAACSNGNGSEETSTPGSQVTESGTTPSGSKTTVTTLADELGYAYLADYARIPYEFEYIEKMIYHDDRIYMLNVEYDDDWNATSSLISMLTDGTGAEKYAIPDFGENVNPRGFAIAPDGNFYTTIYEYYEANSSFVSLLDKVSGNGDNEHEAAEQPEEALSGAEDTNEQPDEPQDGLEAVPDDNQADESEYASGDVNYNENSLLVKFDINGNILSVVDLMEILPDDLTNYYVGALACGQDGTIYLSTNDYGNGRVCVLDDEMNFLFSVDGLGRYVNNLVPYKDTVLATYWGGDSSASSINLEKRAAEAIDMLEYSYRYQTFSSVDGRIYLYDDIYLYAFDEETNELNAVLSWIDTDINTDNLGDLLIISDRLMVMYYHDYTLDTRELMMLKQVDPSEIPQRTVLSYACVNLDYEVKNAIISFNRTNGEYRITIKDYSKYSTDEDWQAGYTQLNNDLLAGELPDIFSMDNLNINNYSSKGLLADIYEYIDNDTEITRDYFTDGLLNVLEASDGKLYQMGYAFNMQTIMGATEVVGEGDGWTFDEMMAAYQSMSGDAELMQWMTKETFISNFLSASINSFINYETGECSFNSDEFISFLEIANSFPDEYEYDFEEDLNNAELMQLGRLMLVTASFYDFDPDYFYAMFTEDELTYKGYPSSTGSGHKLSVNGALAICAASPNREGAWEFIKFMIGDDYQSNLNWYFPVQKAAFETCLQKAIDSRYTTDDDGNEVLSEYNWGVNDKDYVLPPLTENQMYHIRDMIASADGLMSYASDDVIMDIVNEETKAFFAGSKTVQETANLIQSRVSTYILESM